ncbi:MAG: magnesium/cobalt transporter CorA [Candidatus Thorarchaeota archaeon]
MSDYSSKVGLPPGTIVHTGPKLIDEIQIRITDYNESSIEEKCNASIEECVPHHDSSLTRWIDVIGVHDVRKIERIASNFDIHPLITEDLSSTQQRPKVEVMPNGIYVVVRSFDYLEETDEVHSEQISIIVGKGFVLSFQESLPDLFEPIQNRLHQQLSRIRRNLSDYLTYALVDMVVDRYFIVLEVIGDKIEELEDAIVKNPTEVMLRSIYSLKRNLLLMRKYIWPLREVVFRLNRDEATLIQPETQVYLRDLYDHVIRATDHIETYRDSLTTMLDIYLTSISNKMNEVMKVLTVISTIFIPVTFLASIYGMNFIYMPELAIPLGYPVLLISMLGIGITLLLYFRHVKWI